MIFRIADCAYRTKVLPGNRATDGEKKAGPRKEGRPCVILCWHVRAASRTCRSAMRRFGKLLPFRLFRRLYLHRQVCPGFGIWRNRLDRFDSGRSVCRAGYPRNKKADCGSVVPQSAFVNPCDICCTISLPRNRRRSHYCRRPPAIVLRRLPFRLLPLRIGPLRSDPAGRFAGRYTYPAKPLAMHC